LSPWVYVLLCLAVPPAWGLLSYLAFDLAEKWIVRRGAERGNGASWPPEDRDEAEDQAGSGDTGGAGQPG
jgi:hypothetical protein